MKKIDQVRAKGDRELEASLLARPEVKKTIEAFERNADQIGARRQLLGTSLRLLPEMAPNLHRSIRECEESLGMDQPIEVYVYPSASFNAAAVRPENGMLFVMFSSSLLEAFDAQELKFVIGHELGHHYYEHHRIPVGVITQSQEAMSPSVALEIFAWQRHAEISCDRAGLLCTNSLDSAANALFKLSSGLSKYDLKISMDQFIEQAGELRREVELSAASDESPRQDWFSSHPFSPLRLVAAKHFMESELMNGATRAADLESQVEDLMGEMSPSY